MENWIEFDKPKKPENLIKGEVYSFINENGVKEFGEFVEQKGSRVKFIKVNKENRKKS